MPFVNVEGGWFLNSTAGLNAANRTLVDLNWEEADSTLCFGHCLFRMKGSRQTLRESTSRSQDCRGLRERAGARFRKPCRPRFYLHRSQSKPLATTARTCFEGPFGEVIRKTGAMANAMPFRFSTKYQDDETDLLYYGYRYYNPSTGRWLSRDPIEEQGGLNLYCFVSNEPGYHIDGYGTSLVGGPWSMFLYGLYGPPFTDLSISDQLIQQAKSNSRSLEDGLLAGLWYQMQCGKSGIAIVSKDDDKFSIDKPGSLGRANMGRWQLKLQGMCAWSCADGKRPCCCKCTATCIFEAHLSKTWTFQPWGYNDWNGPYTIIWLQTLFNQWYIYHVPGGMYTMSADFTDSRSMEYTKCSK